MERNKGGRFEEKWVKKGKGFFLQDSNDQNIPAETKKGGMGREGGRGGKVRRRKPTGAEKRGDRRKKKHCRRDGRLKGEFHPGKNNGCWGKSSPGGGEAGRFYIGRTKGKGENGKKDEPPKAPGEKT